MNDNQSCSFRDAVPRRADALGLAHVSSDRPAREGGSALELAAGDAPVGCASRFGVAALRAFGRAVRGSLSPSTTYAVTPGSFASMNLQAASASSAAATCVQRRSPATH